MGTEFTSILTALWNTVVGTSSTVGGVTTRSGGLVQLILSEPILMIGLGIWFAGGAIGLAYRLIRG